MMAWNEILNALGGGPGAVMLVGLAWFSWRQMGKIDTLTDMLMQRKDDEIRASERREIAIQQSLEAVTEIVKEYARSK
jgi:hypothetical protein